jgi:hypothetical protein
LLKKEPLAPIVSVGGDLLPLPVMLFVALVPFVYAAEEALKGNHLCKGFVNEEGSLGNICSTCVPDSCVVCGERVSLAQNAVEVCQFCNRSGECVKCGKSATAVAFYCNSCGSNFKGRCGKMCR